MRCAFFTLTDGRFTRGSVKSMSDFRTCAYEQWLIHHLPDNYGAGREYGTVAASLAQELGWKEKLPSEYEDDFILACAKDKHGPHARWDSDERKHGLFAAANNAMATFLTTLISLSSSQAKHKSREDLALCLP